MRAKVICIKQMINLGWKGAACPALEGWVGIGLRAWGTFPLERWGAESIGWISVVVIVFTAIPQSSVHLGCEAIWPSGWKGKHWDKVTRRDAPQSRGDERDAPRAAVGCSRAEVMRRDAPWSRRGWDAPRSCLHGFADTQLTFTPLLWESSLLKPWVLGFPKFLPISFLTQFPSFIPWMKVEGSNYPLLWFQTSTQVLGEVTDSRARAG